MRTRPLHAKPTPAALHHCNNCSVTEALQHQKAKAPMCSAEGMMVPLQQRWQFSGAVRHNAGLGYHAHPCRRQ